MKLPGNAPVYLGEPGVSRVRDEEVMKAQIVGIVATDVAGLRFLIHRSQKRLEHGAFIVAQRDREFASDLVVECRAQVVELLRFVDCESPHERSAVARERDEALLTKRLQRFTQRPPACAEARREDALVKAFTGRDASVEDHSLELQLERRSERMLLYKAQGRKALSVTCLTFFHRFVNCRQSKNWSVDLREFDVDPAHTSFKERRSHETSDAPACACVGPRALERERARA